MQTNHPTISLGFTEQRFPAGVHMCQIYGSDDERRDALNQFALSGLRGGERTSCFSEKVDEDTMAEFFRSHGISLEEAKASGALTLAGTRGMYFQGNRFDPDRMLAVLKQYYLDAIQQGYPAARMIGDMLPEVQQIAGGERLLEYESRVSLLLRECPFTAVCQYDAQQFDGATIMDILKVHPLMLVRGSVVHNPFFISPEEYLSH